ncbi:MAG: hypothetical protein KKH98_02275 [Spirochaetes bacterium]|nr:hypothetical protein [Spirochaetota bacterium]
MNQDQVKEKLLKLEENTDDFQVIFSGKKSRKVDGLYKPEKKEIIIHNKNFQNDNSLLYTAIHEFAHHLQFTQSPVPISGRSHTSFFRNILHTLLQKAESMGIYQNIFKTDPEFIELTKQIKEKFFTENGKLMKEFGEYLIKAHELCDKNHINFNDYMDRELALHRSAAKVIMKCAARDIKPEIGFENMKIVASIPDPVKAKQAEEAFLNGHSPDTVKMQYKSPARSEDKVEQLVRERERIITTIQHLKEKLKKVEERLSDYKSKS